MNRKSTAKAGFTLCSAMAVLLLSGCAGGSFMARGHGPAAHHEDGETREGAATLALAKAEARVAKSPRNAATRAILGQLYLAAGRFESAATTYEDAVSLGDQTPRTALGLALAYVGSGRQDRALQVLAQWRDRIPAGDVGLAVALAGRPAEGVTLLTQALREGENTPKVRQNLAYAYALDGRWAESRVVALQDVPADQLSARLQEWAVHSQADQPRVRVANLLGAPLRSDPGQPAALALHTANHAPEAMMAVALPEAFVAASGELAPIVTADDDVPLAEQAEQVAEPAAQHQSMASRMPANKAAASTSRRSSIERAFPAPARTVPQTSSEARRHLVQLGSFLSMEAAKRAGSIFQRDKPALQGHAIRITQAQVNGRRYFRVVAEGFDKNTAQNLCSTARQRGEACLAYADSRPAEPRLASR